MCIERGHEVDGHPRGGPGDRLPGPGQRPNRILYVSICIYIYIYIYICMYIFV